MSRSHDSVHAVAAQCRARIVAGARGNPGCGRTLAAQCKDDWLRRRAEIAAIRRDLDQIAQSLLALQREWPSLLRSELLKYRPDQPRVPKGNPDGGEWTREGGGTAARIRLADAHEGRASETPGEVISDAGPEILLAQGPGRPGYPIDLAEEEAPIGIGHAIRDHVGKSPQYLLSVVNDTAQRAQRLGDRAEGLAEGSFPSLEAANKLVNATVVKNQGKVDLVVGDLATRQTLEWTFPSPTGYEAYAATEHSKAYIRDTYGVRVIIVRDRSSAKGYQVLTAFPTTPKR